MRTALYARISEAKDRNGVRRQLKDMTARAAREGWAVVGPFVDNDQSAYTGAKPREGYEKMLAAITAGEVDQVLVWRADRLLRDAGSELQRFITVLKKARKRYVPTADGTDYDLSTADGSDNFRRAISSAEHESAVKSERVSRKVRELAEGGWWLGGGRPAGYDLVTSDRPDVQDQDPIPKTLRIREREAEALRGAYSTVLATGNLSLAARELNAAGFTTARGAAFNKTTLRQTLLSKRNIGVLVHNWVDGDYVEHSDEHPATWKGIVRKTTFDKAADILNDESRMEYRSRGGRYLLSGGLLRCAVDGDALTGRPINGKRRYICQHGGKLHLGRDAEPLEKYVGDLASIAEAVSIRVADPAKLSAPLVADADRINAELEELGASDLPLAAIRGRARKLQAELDAVELRLDELAEPAVAALPVTTESEAWRRMIAVRVEFVEVLQVGKGGKHIPLDESVVIHWRDGVTGPAS